MEPINSKLHIPTPRVKLHWAHLTCDLVECQGECSGSEEEGYTCVKCGAWYTGRTEYQEATVHVLDEERARKFFNKG